jgi:hypothetical protein
MKPTETVELVAMITQIWPSMKTNQHTAKAWHLVLADLPFDAAEQAVANLAKFKIGYIGVADIRRQAADDAGLLDIEEGIAYDMAAKVGLNSGTGARMLPTAVQDAYWQMGGAPSFEGDAFMVRARWNKIYAACCAKREKELLSGDLGAALRTARIAIAARGAAPLEASADLATRPNATGVAG